MNARFHDLDRVILEAVAEDYQSFESVVRKLSLAQHAPYEVVEIERVLLSSIADKLVAAYLIHADPPYTTEVGADSENIRRYWFCITEEGRKYLANLLRRQAIARVRGRRTY